MPSQNPVCGNASSMSPRCSTQASVMGCLAVTKRASNSFLAAGLALSTRPSLPTFTMGGLRLGWPVGKRFVLQGHQPLL